MKQSRFIIIILITIISINSYCLKLKWNIANSNPISTAYGLNILMLGNNWAFESGVGSTIGGSYLFGLSGKYLFRSGKTFQPYVQVGTGMSLGGSTTSNSSSVNISLSSYYGGAGFFMMSESVFLYMSLNQYFNSYQNTTLNQQFGFGTKF